MLSVGTKTPFIKITPALQKGCRKWIKVCGASYHWCIEPDGNGDGQAGNVVCKECPDHGRQSTEEDFSQSPVVEKDRDGNLFVVKLGK